MTILLTPFMSCTAKLPIYSFFANAFFPKQAWWIILALYVLGIVTGILAAFIYKKTLFKGEAVPFVMELPNYRLPSLRNVLQLLWEKAKDFLQRAFSVILIATIVVWFLQSFDFRFNLVENSQDSMLAALASLIVPIMKPIGLGDWRIVTSLISGFMAKESVVSIMQLLFGAEEGLTATIGALTAVSILVFSLLYTPCVAAIASIRREMGRKWTLFVVLWQCSIAWAVTFIVRLIMMLFGMR
jgi:ferrous iron transport protein B